MNTRPSTRHFEVLIIGGGAGGLSVAARLCKATPRPEVGILEPSAKHYYQPLWTLVGGGDARKEDTERSEATLIPRGATWIQDAAGELKPDENAVVASSGQRYTYDWLVVAPGIQLNWDRVKGLPGNVGRDFVCSNYSYDTVDYTWKAIQEFQGGTAVFTHPSTPIKCGGAPQKIMYLAADYWRKHPRSKPTRIVFYIGPGEIFQVKKYADSLLKAVQRYGIEVHYQHDLRAIDAANRVATFQRLSDDCTVTTPYDFLHVTPPMSAPDFISQSPLADEAGWAAADKHTLRSPKFPNVFALGDASSLPTSKTGAAIRKQAPVCAKNLLAAIRGEELPASYDGYTSCPLVTGYGKLVLAEFGYDKQPDETFPFDQGKERRSMYWLKKHLLPRLYWDGMLKGRA
ncbi:MAG: FAD/NAD(P)-binding oxidoreductase [Planctomycetota bacterium]